MSSDLLPGGFDEISSGELERSMEHEVEGLMELDDFDLIPSASQPVGGDLSRGARGADGRPAAQPSGRHRQGR